MQFHRYIKAVNKARLVSNAAPLYLLRLSASVPPLDSLEMDGMRKEVHRGEHISALLSTFPPTLPFLIQGMGEEEQQQER